MPSEAYSGADVSRSMEPTSVEHSACGDGAYEERSAEVATVAAVQSETRDDQNASVEEGQQACDPLEGSADCQPESDADALSEMPGTPASLPSLASEPEDTCMPVKFLKVGPAIHSWSASCRRVDVFCH